MERLVYLVDTNIFLEALLRQERTAEVQSFLQSVDLNTIFITDFSVYSIGIALFRLKNFTLFTRFMDDMVVDGIRILSLTLEDLKTLNQPIQRFNIDFDDTYQYTAAVRYNLQLISFDRDFDRTDRERKEPIDILK
ncbi:MAG: PIN domain-containing protein [Candidatus Poribacteria bacterium]|nr:PIN domain-containing protein [Candidatus Poribacteria bacterium]